MIPALSRFVTALRAEGVRVSPPEALDAARALDAVGPERRDRVRAALAAALAKGRRERIAFDRAFERFFAAPARGAGKGRRDSPGAPGGTEAGRGEGKDVPRGARSDDRRAARRGREAEVRIEPPSRGERRGRLRGTRVLRAGAEAEGRRPGAAEPADPARRDLTRGLATDEERRIAAEVPKLLARLRLRRARRARPDRRGRLSPSRLFRRSLETGGVPFEIPRLRPRPGRSRVVLLVDVSYSTASAAGFFLWMAGELLALGRRARVVAFVDRPVDVTRALSRWIGRGPGRRSAPAALRPRRGRRAAPGSGIRPREVAFDRFLDAIPELGLEAPSDYGRVFFDLLRPAARLGGRDAALVVLGDGRTNRFDPLAWAFEELAKRFRTVLWLVPEPASRWGTGDSALERYLEHVDVAVEARDLAGLARGLDELLGRL